MLTIVKISGVYTHRFLHSPDTLLPNVSIADTGKLVRAVIEHGKKYFESTIAFYSQSLSESEKLTELGNGLSSTTDFVLLKLILLQSLIFRPIINRLRQKSSSNISWIAA